MTFSPGEGTVGHIATTGRPIAVRDTRTDPRVIKRATITEPEGIRSYIQVPIEVAGEVFGVFSADYLEPRAFGADDKRLFLALAQRAATAIDTAQLHEQSQALAVVQERSRLARDLHDAVTQTLFSSSLIAETVPELWETDPAEGRQLLQELRQLTRGALAEMRTLLLELRPAALVDTDLADLLRQLCDAATGRLGIPVSISVQGQCSLPPDVHVALYRIAQEALNNVVKHSEATRVTVSLRCGTALCEVSNPASDQVELLVTDNGKGFEMAQVPANRLGLGIIRERAQAIGARLEIESQPGKGTRTSARWSQGGKEEGHFDCLSFSAQLHRERSEG
jgi:two-component system nitrate/nitrite sensor histidine kinase NarX